MTRTGDTVPARRCSECGLAARPGELRCDFCGAKLPPEVAAEPAAAGGRTARKTTFRTAREIAEVFVIGCLVVGSFFIAQKFVREQKQAAPPPARGSDNNQNAYTACAAHIRHQVQAPFTVKSFGTIRVAEEQGGYAVSGTVELQDSAGAAIWRRYYCTVRLDDAAGMVVERGALR